MSASPDSQQEIQRLCAALAAAEGNLARIVEAFDHLESGVVLYGGDDRIVFCNRRFREIYSQVADLLVPGTPYVEVARAFYRRGFESRTQLGEDAYVKARAEKHLDPDEGDYEFQLGDDVWLLVSDRKTADGGVIGFRLDITARKIAERELEASEQRFRNLLAMSSDWYWEQDEQFRFTRISGGIRRSLGIDPEQLYGLASWDMPYLGIGTEQMDEHRRQIEAHQPFRDFQYAYTAENGETWWVNVSGEPVFDASGAFRGYRGVGTNITEKKRTEAQIRELAEYDFLTGLPNRMLLGARFDFAQRQLQRQNGGMSLLYIDLDRFKNINDSLGHHVGDEILAEMARRLIQSVRTTDTVARHGGDEFIVLLPGVDDATHLAHIAETLLAKLGEPYQHFARELTVTPSIGITVWPNDGQDLNALIKNADLAMYHSKSEGRNQFSFFRAEMNARVNERLTLENALRRALAKNEFSLVYQPIFHLPEQRLIGAEALLRWDSEELGSIEPGRFIPVAEESGLIVPIGEWVAREACAQLRRWRDAGLDDFTVAINVSAVQFKTGRLVEVLQAAMREFRLHPQDIEIELTESALVSEGDTANSSLNALALAGFRLVVDDFGTGYSNLLYLKRFDIAKLKIDRSFVRDITADPNDAAITRGIIGLAKSLGLRVVAEGVEQTAQLDYLLACDCEEAQGYLLSKPLSPLAFRASF
ncbi:MAG TPA: EAL domain-containing protein [Usitatibacteraceae bacterium]